MAFGGENAESYYDDGVTLAMRGDVRQAIKCFTTAIHMDNSMSSAYHQLAKCYHRLGDYDKAIQLLQQVVGIKQDAVAPRIDLGYALAKAGRTPDARNEFERVATLEPEKGRGALGLAEVAFLEGDWGSAVERAQTAVTLGGAGFAALFLLGRAARLAGNRTLSDSSLDKANKLAAQSTESNPSGPEGHFLQGEIAFAQEKYVDALEHFRRAEEHADADKVYVAYGEHFGATEILCKQGLCFQRIGKLDRARELGERIIKSDPKNKLGLALSKLEE